MKNGSYYDGAFRGNMAEGQGKFFSGNFYYEGHFDDNKFHGIGTEKDERHTFHGEYDHNVKKHGTFSWQDEGQDYEYVG
jgi:hypothetical protein